MQVDLKKYNRPYDGMNLQKLVEKSTSLNTEGRCLSFLLEGQAAHIGTRYKIYREKTGAEWQMFDLLADPNETKNISSIKTDLYNTLIAEWSLWEKSVKNSAAGKDY